MPYRDHAKDAKKASFSRGPLGYYSLRGVPLKLPAFINLYQVAFWVPGDLDA